MDANELKELVRLHGLYLNGSEEGRRLVLLNRDLSGSDLRGSNLRGSDLRGSNLSGSDLSGSNLRWSDLRGSDLSGSDLRGSNLSGSDLSGSDLRDSKGAIVGPVRSDGHQFFAILYDHGWMIQAGCQFLSLTDYREHTKGYGDQKKMDETSDILAYLERRIASKGDLI